MCKSSFMKFINKKIESDKAYIQKEFKKLSEKKTKLLTQKEFEDRLGFLYN